jgi:lipopolysaccharide biosynthesis glycosyltransferase
VVDEGYVKYMTVTIASILKNTPEDVPLHFHVINDGSVSGESVDKVDSLHTLRDFSITWHTENRQMHHEQREDTRPDIPMVTNYRLLLGSILSDIDKIIFLDADLIVTGDLSELWTTDVSGYYMAAVPASSSWGGYQKSLGIPDQFFYCNTGVTLLNLKRWREEKVEDTLLKTEKKYRGIYCFYDQCVLNAALFSQTLYIGQEWNFRPAIWEGGRKLREKYPVAFSTPRIIHWASPVKPWQDRTVPYAVLYEKYAGLTPYYETIKSQRWPLHKIVCRKLASIGRKLVKAICHPMLAFNRLRSL